MEWNWWAINTGKTKNKNKDRKTKKSKQNKRHKIRTESTKDATKREIEVQRIERRNRLNKIENIKTVIKELTIEIKFNESANNLDIRLLKAHQQISKKRCFKKYCSCDQACQFSVL